MSGEPHDYNPEARVAKPPEPIVEAFETHNLDRCLEEIESDGVVWNRLWNRVRIVHSFGVERTPLWVYTAIDYNRKSR